MGMFARGPCCVLFLLAGLSCVWAAKELPPLETKVYELEAFSAISDCLPFNVKVVPAAKREGYLLTVEAEKALLGVVKARVRNGVLSLGLSKGFETERVIKVTVQMPKDALDTIIKASTSVLVVAPGLKVKDLTIMASGVSAVRLFDANIDELIVEATDNSIVFAEGKIDKARFDVSGTARAYCYGLRSESEVFADGIGRVFIDADNSKVVISGEIDGLGRVFTTNGKCKVRGTLFRASCEEIRSNSLPSFEAKHSCGLIVDGKISCKKADGGTGTYTSAKVDGTSASTFTSATGSGSASSTAFSSSSTTSTSSASSSSTGGGTTRTSFSSSSSDGDHRFESLVSSEGEGAAVAVAATRCLDKKLDMFEDA